MSAAARYEAPAVAATAVFTATVEAPAVDNAPTAPHASSYDSSGCRSF